MLKPRIPLPYQGRVHRLTVTKLQPETAAAVTIAFRVTRPLRQKFAYAARQYVTRTLVTDAVERARAVPPTTCRTGTCSTCVAQVIEGHATMRECSHAKRWRRPPQLVVDYDSAI